MLEHPEIGWIERTGYPSWMQEQDGFCGDGSEIPYEGDGVRRQHHDQTQQIQAHPYAMHLRPGGVIVKTKSGRMISCPDPVRCSANLRTTWHSGEESAIVEWNGLVQAERYRRKLR